ncbi:hypothetical protein I317_01918 [Kwoniella heveanensis CBS 569]|nr:hypothetical protein I317_01918 [Kwoniella heveanensis CBS 569]
MSLGLPQIQLNSGNSIPALAFGTATVHWGEPCAPHILSGLEAGFRHIDTAESYGNQASVGEALTLWQRQGGKREDVCITTKWGKRDPTAQNDPRQALLDALQEDTQPYSLQAAWSIMENLKQEGLCKDIGLSNFGASDIATLSQSWTFVPAVNQFELSPHCAHDPRTRAIVDICAKHHITPMAYSSLGPLRPPRARFPDDPGAPRSTCPISSGFEEGQPLRPLLHRIGSQRGGMTETQVLLAWTWQVFRGCIVT